MKLIGVEGLEVTLRMNDIDLKEYEDESGALIPSKGSTYVEATSGAEFSIHVRSQHTQFRSPTVGDVLVCSIILDGKEVTGAIYDMHPARARDLRETVKGVAEKRGPGYYMSSFQFAELATSKSHCTALIASLTGQQMTDRPKATTN